MGAAISLAVFLDPVVTRSHPNKALAGGMISGGQRFGSSPRAEIQRHQMTAETTTVAEGC